MRCCCHTVTNLIPPTLPPACLLLLADSCVKGITLGSCSRSDLAADLRGLSTHIASALARHQQQTACLSSQLCSCQAAQQARQQQLATAEAQVQELRDCLGAAEASRQTAVQAAVAQTEAKYSKKLIKVEARVLGMVRARTGNISRVRRAGTATPMLPQCSTVRDGVLSVQHVSCHGLPVCADTKAHQAAAALAASLVCAL